MLRKNKEHKRCYLDILGEIHLHSIIYTSENIMVIWTYFICFFIQTTYAQSPFVIWARKKKSNRKPYLKQKKAAEMAKRQANSCIGTSMEQSNG